MSKYQPITIREALREIQDGHYLLPAFQREFVWKHTQIEMLFDSLMRGYPINSMLFWRLTDETAKRYRFYRFIKNFTEQHRTKNEEFDNNLRRGDFAVLDGQQRLTSLYIGLCGTYAYRKKYAWAVLNENNYPTRRLYLDISREYDDEEDDKKYRFDFLKGHTEDLFVDGDMKWFRVGKILEFYDVKRKVAFLTENPLTVNEQVMLERLNEVVNTNTCINYYQEETEDHDVAVNVFSRINSGGTALSFADILLALLIANWKHRDARNEIGGLVDAVNGMGFYISHDYVLKALLYLFHDDVRFRIGSFDNDFCRRTEEEWEQVRQAVIATFGIVRGFGLDASRLTSNYATLPLLFYIYKRKIWNIVVDSVAAESDRLIMKRWLLKSLLLRTFSFRYDGQLRRARRVLQENDLQAYPDNEIERTLGQTVNDNEFLETVLSYQYESRYAFVVLSLLYSHLTFEGVKYDVDHIHPRALWNKDVADWSVFNSLVNLQLLPEKQNKGKSDMPFEEWMKMRLRELNVDRESFLNNSLIPNIDLSIGNFCEFAEKRKELLKEKLRVLLSRT